MMHAMTKGKYDKIRHRNPLQRYDRKSVMLYLGIDEQTLSTRVTIHVFSARPLFGTQHLHDTDIVSVEEVEPQPPYVNARWP